MYSTTYSFIKYSELCKNKTYLEKNDLLWYAFVLKPNIVCFKGSGIKSRVTRIVSVLLLTGFICCCLAIIRWPIHFRYDYLFENLFFQIIFSSDWIIARSEIISPPENSPMKTFAFWNKLKCPVEIRICIWENRTDSIRLERKRRRSRSIKAKNTCVWSKFANSLLRMFERYKSANKIWLLRPGPLADAIRWKNWVLSVFGKWFHFISIRPTIC